jgi:hypothetical protein
MAETLDRDESIGETTVPQEQLINNINKYSARFGISAHVEDVIGNGRTAFMFSGGKKLRDALDEVSGPVRIVQRALYKTGINVIQSQYTFPNSGKDDDCRNWAFDQIGLPQYKSSRIANTLLKEDLPELKWIPSPEIGSIALYFSLPVDLNELFAKENAVEHWGVVRDASEGIIVYSKWGDEHVFGGPVERVPSIYGEAVMFFEKVD